MTVEIRVDYRESALINHLKSDSNADVFEDNLELGDIQIIDNDNGINLVFERKTISDLAASLKDGRYKEQKCRILSHYNPKHVTYIIEGSTGPISTDRYGLTNSVYEGIYINTMYRDGIHILFVDDVQDTAKWIRKVATKVIQNPAKFAEGCGQRDYVSSCKAKSKKSDNVTPETCYIMQLCQVPGVSVKIARNIQEKYKTYRELITVLSSAPEPCKLLSQLPLIGAKKAKMIVSFLLA